MFDQIDDQGRPTGVVNLAGAEQWRDKYDRPEKELDPIFDRCEMTFGNPAVYWTNGGNPAYLYGVVQEWEVGKLARPNVPNVVSTWIQTEFVDNYPLSTYRFQKPDGTYQVPGHEASGAAVVRLRPVALRPLPHGWGVLLGDRTGYSEDVADAGEAGEGGMQTPVRKTFATAWKDVTYYIKYFGFYNYHVLGMWQASQNKDIIEAKTEWSMPEFRTSTGGSGEPGTNAIQATATCTRNPSCGPKQSADGSEWLVIACNPYNQGVQQVSLRCPE